MLDQLSIEEIRHLLLHQLDLSKQMIEDLTDEELDAIAGGGWADVARVVRSDDFLAYKNGLKDGAERAQNAGKKWDAKSIVAGATGGVVAGSAVTYGISKAAGHN